MTSTGGYNPMRWNCENNGCWNVKYRPNIEHFANALPRKIAMSDIDAVTEVNGHFLFLEWKSYQGEIPIGQRILFERITKLSPNITVVVVAGDCETMNVSSIQRIKGGEFSSWVSCDLQGLFDRIERWAKRVDVHTVDESKLA